jgi:hypothetical protein
MHGVKRNAHKEDTTDNNELFVLSKSQTEKLEFTWDVKNIQSDINTLIKEFHEGKSWRFEFESGKTVQ